MSALGGIFIDTRQSWERRLLRGIERALIEAADGHPDPAGHLGDMLEAFEAAGWQTAYTLTRPWVPEQFRSAWTVERARDLLEGAFMLATMRTDRAFGKRMMREAIMPALEVQP